MQSLLKKAKLPLHFTPHCLRHTYASILLADGVSPVYVQEQLGHATIELTVSTYGRWLKKQAAGVLDRLDMAMNFERGSNVVAAGDYPRHPQGGTNLQLPEIPWSALEPATRIERVTCGLRIARRPTPIQQINHLAWQIVANSSRKYANPQPAATIISLLKIA